ncbi:unnamed protein product [Cylicocyclus nassatus]|uniref:Uncharacterized protein n=1 Tax=Cylicocyclus nassatus TaxID=53992 RepID=A0AA36M7G1_CYLNA|nr:unnamed protein product [Cylicocyclus nassatus]CAJ0600648.1 unnamed protein product [Cylicocyclus nassatus]
MTCFVSIVFISFALLINFCRPVFLAHPLARASTTGLPRIDDATQKLFHENGFHGELVRRAGRHEPQCGVVLLDYEKYTEGEWFESILEPYEETLRETVAGYSQAKVFSELKKDAVGEHKKEMRALFEQYRNSTQLYNDEMDVPNSGARINSARIIKKDMYHGVISMLRNHAEEEQQKRSILERIVATRTELHDMEEMVEVETSL